MSVKGTRAGRAFVELFLDDRRLVRGLRAAQDKLKTWGATVKAMGAKLFAAGAAVAAPFALAVKKASDAEETINRFEAVFGDQAKAAGDFANALGAAVGRSVVEIKDAMSSFQGFFVGLGLGKSEARSFSQELEALALDFASFNNLSDDEAVGRFISALSGSGEVLDRFGINIKDAALSQELMRQGIKGGTKAATEQQKALARLAIIKKSMDDQGATGDAEKTAGSFSNLMKALSASVKDVAHEIGSTLIPALKPIVAALANIVRATGGWIKNNASLVLSVGTAAVVTMQLGATLIGVGIAAHGISVGLGALSAIFGAILSPIGLIVAGLAGMATWFLTSTDAGQKALGFLHDKFGQLKTDALAAFGAIRDALGRGDFAAAAAVAWSGLKLVWAQATGFLQEKWIEFTGFLRSTLNESWSNSAAFIIKATAGISAGWTETVDFMGDVWSIFAAGLTKTWHNTIGFIKKAWVRLKGLFSSDVDVEAEVKRINDETAQKNEAADAARDGRIFKREEDRKKKLDQIAQERDGALAENENIRKGRGDQIRADQEKQRKALEDEAAAARKKFDDAVAAAKNADEPAEAEIPSFDADKARKSVQATAAAVGGAAGTFSAAGARGLGMTSHAQQMVALLTGINAGTKKLVDQGKENAAAFE